MIVKARGAIAASAVAAPPPHVAIIMDGNGRWATLRGLPRTIGHIVGEQRLHAVVDEALVLGLKHLSVFAFSTENWRRSPREVRAILKIVERAVALRHDDFERKKIRVQWLGSGDNLPDSLIAALENVQARTADNDRLVLTLCVNYGGRRDIAAAARAIALDVASGVLRIDAIDEATISRYLGPPQVPPVDLLIRTSGERRLSNFLLWHCSDALLLFPRVKWPDFGPRQLRAAVEQYLHTQSSERSA